MDAATISAIIQLVALGARTLYDLQAKGALSGDLTNEWAKVRQEIADANAAWEAAGKRQGPAA